jgi:ionotropic glutamate receptor
MEKDFKTTGKCDLRDLALVKETEYLLPWTWALAKKSFYTEYINRGLLIIIIIIIFYYFNNTN